MSKKRKRYNKAHRTAGRKTKKWTKDNHHLCYTKRSWGGGVLSELRRFHYCIILIPKETLHKAIHKAVPTIPAPKWEIAKYALEQLRMLEEIGAISANDSIEKRLVLLASLFANYRPTADGFIKQLEVVRKYNRPP